MSYTNGTTHYNLPLTTGADKRDWSDTNQAFSDVDAALYGAVQDTAQAELDIDALETRMDTAEQNISTNTGNIAGLDTRVTTVEGAVTSLSGQVTDTRQDLEDMICAYNEASATSTHSYSIGDYFIYNDVLYRATQAIAIGDTIVPDTNCSTTNVSTELLAIKNKSHILDSYVETEVTSYQGVVGKALKYVHDHFSSSEYAGIKIRAKDLIFTLSDFGARVEAYSCKFSSDKTQQWTIRAMYDSSDDTRLCYVESINVTSPFTIQVLAGNNFTFTAPINVEFIL